ncbi:hypothetical protein [Aliiroseovarius sp. YM-037]|uniref:hypothetical protein n=1 Tax=Aliiroseovarius sp. YM-037 TaxID=3341728 RepID=UPI003A80C061
MTMFKTVVFGAALAATSTFAYADDVQLSEIDVQTDLSAVEGANAMEYWPTLNDDLRAAIAAQVDLAEDANRVMVEIHSVTLDGSGVLPESGEFNQLQGTIAVFEPKTGQEADDGDIAPVTSYPLNLDASVADGGVAPEGWIRIPPSTDDFYTALVNTFAIEVVKNLEEM